MHTHEAIVFCWTGAIWLFFSMNATTLHLVAGLLCHCSVIHKLRMLSLLVLLKNQCHGVANNLLLNAFRLNLQEQFLRHFQICLG